MRRQNMFSGYIDTALLGQRGVIPYYILSQVNDYGIIIQGRGGCSCGKPAGRVA
jgi:hypothetical protein